MYVTCSPVYFCNDRTSSHCAQQRLAHNDQWVPFVANGRPLQPNQGHQHWWTTHLGNCVAWTGWEWCTCPYRIDFVDGRSLHDGAVDVKSLPHSLPITQELSARNIFHLLIVEGKQVIAAPGHCVPLRGTISASHSHHHVTTHQRLFFQSVWFQQ